MYHRIDRTSAYTSVCPSIPAIAFLPSPPPPPPQPHLRHAAGVAGSRGAPCARNRHTTALFAYECQSFLDNLIAGLGEIGAWNDPRGCWFRGRAAGIKPTSLRIIQWGASCLPVR